MAAGERPVVAVWRNLWLPYSETFVSDHVRSLGGWSPLTMGLFRTNEDPGLRVDAAPFRRTSMGYKLAAISRRTGHRYPFDRLIRVRAPRLVHAHFGTGAVEVLPLAQRNALPLVVTFHGHDLSRALAEDHSGAYVRRLGEVFAYASLLLPVSSFLARRLIELGAPAEKVSVHYVGIPVHAPLVPPDQSRRGIAFVGRLTEQKGVADLLAAYACLSPSVRAETPLRIVGDGPLRSRLEEQAREIVDGEVDFLGVQSPAGVRTVLSEAAVVAGPSTKGPQGEAEGFGLTFLEAALAGAPVVGYDYAGVSESVVDGHTGLLAPVGDVAALAASIERLLTDPALARRLGGAGQARVLRDFDITGRTARLERMYDAVVAGTLDRSSGVRP